MKEFIAENWLIMIEIILGIISLVIVILKKTKLVSLDTPFEKLLSKLPELISKAEILSKDGRVKKSYVLSVAYAYLADLTGKPVEEVSGIYCDRISKAIEDILETPMKKKEVKEDDQEKND